MQRTVRKIESDSFKVNRFRLLTGILLGLLYSIILYSFCYVMREGIRILSVTYEYDLWILTEEEVNFYNLFYAFISVILGQSICFTFWFDKPRKPFLEKRKRKHLIVNDQRGFTWYFLSWFSKLSFLYAIFFGLVFYGGFYTFSFYSDYKFLFILLVIVLFLQTWNSIRLIYKRKSFRWMIYSIIVVTIISLCLSKVNLIDYKSINEGFLKYNINYNHNLELSESSLSEKSRNNDIIEKIYMVESKEYRKDSLPIVFINLGKIKFENLDRRISELNTHNEHWSTPVKFQLHIHKATRMKYVNQLKYELSYIGVHKIGYATLPENLKYDKRYYQDFIYKATIPTMEPLLFQYSGGMDRINRYSNIIEITHSNNGKCFINGIGITWSHFKPKLKSLIIKNPDYIIHYKLNDNIDFETYFEVLSNSKELIFELRHEHSIRDYNTSFENLEYKEPKLYREIEKKLPYRLIELTPEMINSDNLENY